MSLFSFAWLIKTLTKDGFSALLVLILLPMCWSVHDVPDALVSFAVFLPLVVTFTSLSLIFLCYYQDTRQSGWLALSLLLYLLNLTCYELGIVTFLLAALLIWRSSASVKDKIQTIKPYVIITVAYFIAVFITQYTDIATYDGIKVNLGSHSLSGFIAQLNSSLPLSYYFYANHSHLSLAILLQAAWVSKIDAWVALYLFSITLIATFWLIPRVQFSKKNLECVALIGLILMLFPALLMGISQKYQVIVTAGRGYIPVYVQYFGTVCLLLSGICYFNSRVTNTRYKTGVHTLMAITLSCTLVLAWLVNLTVVQQNNETSYNTRGLLEHALQSRLLATIPENAYLIERITLWNTADFYLINAGKQLAGVIDIDDKKNLQTSGSYRQHPYYIETFHLKNTRQGYVAIGLTQALSVKNITPTIQVMDKINIANPIIFVAATTAAEYRQISAALCLRFHLNPEQLEKMQAIYSHSPEPWILISLANRRFELPINHDTQGRQ